MEIRHLESGNRKCKVQRGLGTTACWPEQSMKSLIIENRYQSIFIDLKLNQVMLIVAN